MGRWAFSQTDNAGGRFLIVATRMSPGGRRTDITLLRGAPTEISSYSSGDPFGDSTAVLTFPAISIFDDLDAADLSAWLGYYSNVDIYWAAAMPGGDNYPDNEQVQNPATGAGGYVAPLRIRDSDGTPGALHAVKVWEGFIASMDFADEALQVQCQGALFQVDRYLTKPFYPMRPWPLEKLIAREFDHRLRPHLRTMPMLTNWPAAWKRTVPDYSKDQWAVYAPIAEVGDRWTAYTSRETGSWDHSLTGFVQDHLSVMITRAEDGVRAGDQWTIRHLHESNTMLGRTPILEIRDSTRPADFDVWVGAPGVSVELSGDSTQSENVIYGSGTDVHGVAWRNAVINTDGTETTFQPLAADVNVYPYKDNPDLERGAFVSEANTKFGPGFTQLDAIDVAKQNLARDRYPGWSGTLTVSTDPSAFMSRWAIAAGMTVRLKGFLGSGEDGVPFHISAVTARPEAGTVEMTIDTRYRDLLTVQEALERTRDPLTPVKMLQVNRSSMLIPDIQAPWDYSAGSGFIPRISKNFHTHRPVADVFPYEDWATKHPPLHYAGWYVPVKAAAKTRAGRWTSVPILTAQAGQIMHTELACYDKNGRLLKIPFHLSIYRFKVFPSAMPRDSSGPSPFIDNAFESIDPATGQPWPKGNFRDAPDGMIIGWGNQQGAVMNRAGFSPGSEADGNAPTGLLIDDATWSFDNADGTNLDYDIQAKIGTPQTDESISLWAMLYAEYTETVYFMGRLFKANAGS